MAGRSVLVPETVLPDRWQLSSGRLLLLKSKRPQELITSMVGRARGSVENVVMDLGFEKSNPESGRIALLFGQRKWTTVCDRSEEPS